MGLDEVYEQHRQQLRKLLADHNLEHLLDELPEAQSRAGAFRVLETIEWAIETGAGCEAIAAVLRARPDSPDDAVRVVERFYAARPDAEARDFGDVPPDESDGPDEAATTPSPAPPAPDTAAHEPDPASAGAAVQASWASAFASVGGPATRKPIGSAMRPDQQGQARDRTGAGGGVTAEPPAVDEAAADGWTRAFSKASEPGARPFPAPSATEADAPQPDAHGAAANPGAVAGKSDDGWSRAFAHAGR